MPANTATALASLAVAHLPPEALTWIGVAQDRGTFSEAQPETSYLAIAVPVSPHATTVFTLDIDVFDPPSVAGNHEQIAAA